MDNWTSREVQIALARINVRQKRNFSMKASLHGITIPVDGIKKKVEEKSFSEKENKIAEKAMNDAIMRLKSKRKR